jgi:DNA-binding NarL/FixJ family response regulator
MTIRVVMAEDHVLVRQGIRNVLESSGRIEVVGEAGNGREAVELTERLQPDVVLMDIAMPEMNGIDATRLIKAANPNAAVLVLTAYDDDGYVFALLEAGAAGYLLKNSRSEELAAAVEAVCRGESVLSPPVARKVLSRFRPGADGQAGPELDPLTDRELDILRLAATGLPNKAIASQLSLSSRTVQFHLAHIFEKMSVASRTEAVVSALKRGWLRLEEID